MLNLSRWIDLLIVMTSFEIRARYKHAVLGFLWVFLNPLFQMLIIGLIFSSFLPISIDNYFLYVFSGLLPWMFFSSSFSMGTTSLVENRLIIQKSSFPREIIVLSVVFSHFFHYLISLLLLGFTILMINFSFDSLLYVLVSFLVSSVWMIIFTIGVTLFTSSLYVKYRDVSYIVTAILSVWFYATPVIYSLDIIPDKMIPVLFLNPLTGIIEVLRMSSGHFSDISDLTLISLSLIISVLCFYVGVSFFNKNKLYFDDWI